MGEFDRIARLAARFGTLPGRAIGIGDDAAVLPASGTDTVITVDAAVEGVHFSRDLLALDLAAERAVEAAMSDVAAMGGTVAWSERGGCGVLIAITAPATLDEWEFDALIDGIARATERAGARVLGGNLSRAPVISLTTTVIGRLEVRALTRSGARVGDRLCVTGTVGGAALGLRALGAHVGDEPRYAPFVARWRSPRARLELGVRIARFASSGIDVSDGLAQDAGHIGEASGVGIVIDTRALPMHPDARAAAEALGADAVELALVGGEDYELCFTASAPEASDAWCIIGEVVSGSGVWLRDEKGTRKWESAAWDHFAR